MTTGSKIERTLDDAMQDFLDEYGSQYLRLEGPDMEGNWHAEIVAGGIEDAVGVSRNPAEAINMALGIARAQEPKAPTPASPAGGES